MPEDKIPMINKMNAREQAVADAGLVPPEEINKIINDKSIDQAYKDSYLDKVRRSYDANQTNPYVHFKNSVHLDPSYKEYMDVSEIRLNDMHYTNNLRADRQSTFEKLYRTVDNFGANVGAGIMHDIGSLGVIAMAGANVITDENTNIYKNALTEWANSLRNPHGEVFENSDNIDLGTVLNKGSEVLEPLAQFAIEGELLGWAMKPLSAALSGGANTLVNAEKIVNMVNSESRLLSATGKMTQKGIANFGRFAEAGLPRFVNSAGIAHFASVDVAANAYDKFYTYADEHYKDLSEEDKKRYAFTQASLVYGGNFLTMMPIAAIGLKGKYRGGAVKKEADAFMEGLYKEAKRRTVNGNFKEAFKSVLTEASSKPEYAKYLSGGQGVGEYLKAIPGGAASFGAMHIAGGETTLANMNEATSRDAILKQNESGWFSRYGQGAGSYIEGMNKNLTDILTGKDPDGAKELLNSLITGAVISSGHRFYNNRIGRTHSYKYGEDGKYIEKKVAEGEKREIETEKIWKKQASKNAKDRLFKYYRNSLIKDLERIEGANSKLEEYYKAEDKSKLDYTLDDVYEELFDVNAFNSVTMGGAKYIKRSLKEIADVDNTKNLGEPIAEEIVKVDKELSRYEGVDENSLSEQEKNTKKELTDLRAELVKQHRKFDGKTQAMVEGYTDVAFDGKNEKEANEYKLKAEESIAEIDKFSEIYENNYKLYGFGKAAEFEVPEIMTRLEMDIYRSEKRIKRLEEEQKGKNTEKRNEINEYIRKSEALKIKQLELVKAVSLSKRYKSQKHFDKVVKKGRDKSALEVDRLSKEVDALAKELQEDKVMKEYNDTYKEYKDISAKLNFLVTEREATQKSKVEGETEEPKYRKEMDKAYDMVEGLKYNLDAALERLDKHYDNISKEYGNTEKLKTEQGSVTELHKEIKKIKGEIAEATREYMKVKRKYSVANGTKERLDKEELRVAEELVDATTKKNELEESVLETNEIIEREEEVVKKDKAFHDLLNAHLDRTSHVAELNRMKTKKGLRDFIDGRQKEIGNDRQSIVDAVGVLRVARSAARRIKDVKIKSTINDLKERVKRKGKEEPATKEEVSRKEKEVSNNSASTIEQGSAKKKPSEKEDVVKAPNKEIDTEVVPEDTKVDTPEVKEEVTPETEDKVPEELARKEDSIPKKNGNNAYTLLDNKDPRYELKKEVADTYAYASNDLRAAAETNPALADRLEEMATYIDDVSYFLGSQATFGDREKGIAKYVEGLVNGITSMGKDISREKLQALATEINSMHMDSPITLIDEALLAKRSTSDALVMMMDSIPRYRVGAGKEEAAKYANSTAMWSMTQWKDIDVNARTQEFFDKIVDNKISFYSVEEGKVKTSRHNIWEMINSISGVITKERLTNADIEKEYANVVGYFLGTYEKSAGLDRIIKGEDAYKQSLSEARKLLTFFNNMYDAIIKERVANGEEIERESFEHFYLDDNFKVTEGSKVHEENDLDNKVGNPTEGDLIAPHVFVENTNKRISAANVAMDVTGFDRFTGESNNYVTKGVIKDSPTEFNVDDRVSFKVDEEYNGTVNYFNGTEYVKRRWKELAAENKKSMSETEYKEWYKHHRPIKILDSKGREVGYVPMLSSVNNATIDPKQVPSARAELKDFREGILKGKNGQITYKSKGYPNTTKEARLVSEYLPHLTSKVSSYGILKRDGVYIGKSQVIRFNKKEREAFRKMNGSTVVLFKGSDGSMSHYGLYKMRIDGTSDRTKDTTVNMVEDIKDAMNKIIKSDKDVQDIRYALGNTVFVSSVKDANGAVEKLSTVSEDNAGIVAIQGKDKVNAYAIGNQSEIVIIDKDGVVEGTEEAMTKLLGKVHYSPSNIALDKRVNLLARDKEGNIIAKKGYYNTFIKDKLATNLLEKTRPITEEEYKIDRSTVKTDTEFLELSYTNNSVSALKLIDADAPIKKDKVEEVKKKKIEEERKEDFEDFDEETLGLFEEADTKAEDFASIATEKMDIHNKIIC